jgi:alpha-beta hydrolase superfamily lysophospholipase
MAPMRAFVIGSLALAAVVVAPAPAAPPKHPLLDACVPKALRSHAIAFRASDRVRLVGLELGKGRRGVVLAHELNGTLCNWLPFARLLVARGFHVLLFDARDAGKSAYVSFPQSDQLDRDVVGAGRELRRRGAGKLLLMGASAGGTAALAAAPKLGATVAGVAALSSPAEYVDMDAVAAVRRISAPSFFAVGEADSQFVAGVKQLYDAAASTMKQLEVVDGSTAHGTELLSGPNDGTAMRAKLLAFSVAALPS